jgi:spermidine/putrescine transport system ATP-binding protein
MSAKISEMTYLGTDTHYTLVLSDGSHLVARVQSNSAMDLAVGHQVSVTIDVAAVRVLAS